MKITGNTKLIPIIGNPISQVFSPPAVNKWLASQNIDAVMVGMDINQDGAPAFFDCLKHWNNLIGCSVTFPFKQLAFQKVDEATERSKRLGVVNTIRREPDGRLIGDMTDGLAMIRAIEKTEFKLKNKCAMVIGSGGGSGIAIVEALCIAEVSHLILRETNLKRLNTVRKFVEAFFPNINILDDESFEADIYINATCIGIKETDKFPLEESLIHSNGVYCDVVTKSPHTPFIEAAINCNAVFVTGADMGLAQIELQMSHFGCYTD